MRVTTRLGDAHLTIRLGRVDATGRLNPWESAPAVPSWQRWPLSELRVSRHRIPEGVQVEAQYRAAVAAVQATWGRWDREIPIVPMVPDMNGRWVGRLLRGDRTIVTLQVCPRDGLTYPAAENTSVGDRPHTADLPHTPPNSSERA